MSHHSELVRDAADWVRDVIVLRPLICVAAALLVGAGVGLVLG